MKNRPIIGIACRINPKKHHYYLPETYVDAIWGAGGWPVLIPLIAEKDFVDGIATGLDGICLSGSDSDIDPLLYGREPKAGLGPVIPRRDRTDFLLIEAAERRGLPLLAICFGIQSLNVYRGGTLIQDIAKELPDGVNHEQAGEYERRSHTIDIQAGSLLDEMNGSRKAVVNSFHHQAIDTLGSNLEAIAWSADGLIEAVIDPRSDLPFLGVQWHPEVGWRDDLLSRRIMKHFVNRAAGARAYPSMA